MSGRRKTRDNVGMNLFPFLAVLICTMGSLIMLLVVMVQQARVRANEPPVAVIEPEIDSATVANEEAQQQRMAEYERQKALAEKTQREIDGFKWKTSMLRQSYEQTIGGLAEKRLALSHLEAHTRELSDQASMMQTEAEMIAAAAIDESKDRESEKQDLDQLKSQIASASQELQTVREELANQTIKYTLIPYEGPNGTSRPPIYIECLSDRVVLQPENVVLIGEDFRAPLTIDNPLALALRAKREFMQENGLLHSGAEPYPLLVVRPGSAASYAAARGAMKAWEAEFGYELIEADIELDYQPADPRLTELLNDVVIEARGKRRLVRSVRARPTQQRELLRPSSSGGFEAIRNGSSSYASARSSAQDGYGDVDSADDDPFGVGEGTRGDKGLGNFRGSQSGGSENRRGHSVGGGRYGQGAGGGGSETHSVETDAGVAGPSGNSLVGSAGANVSGNGGGESAAANGSGGKGSSGSGGAAASPSGSAGLSAEFNTTESLSQTRGRNWALPNPQVSAVGIRRPINVICDQQRLILVPEKGTRQEVQIFRHDGSISAVVDPFVDAVRTRLEGWGIAGQGIYWRPLLQIQVSDDAAGNYRQLLQLLDNSGIEVTREP